MIRPKFNYAPAASRICALTPAADAMALSYAIVVRLAQLPAMRRAIITPDRTGCDGRYFFGVLGVHCRKLVTNWLHEHQKAKSPDRVPRLSV